MKVGYTNGTSLFLTQEEAFEGIRPHLREVEALRFRFSSRGGGVEIALDLFGFPGEKMSAFQSYLGGGLLGAVRSDVTMSTTNNLMHSKQLNEIKDQLKRFYHQQTDPGTEFEGSTYEDNQKRPARAY